MDLRNVEPIVVSGLFYRHIPAAGDPLFQPDLAADGRWQRGEAIEGFYLAGSAMTAWREWYRALAELAVPPMRQMPRDLWRFHVHVERVADLSSPSMLLKAGLPPPIPNRSQWPLFQAVGEALAKEGWRGVLYSSASGAEPPEGNNALCLFRPESDSPDIPGVYPSGAPTRYDEPPAPPTNLRT